MEIDNVRRLCRHPHTYHNHPLNHLRYPPVSVTGDSSPSACLALGLTDRTEPHVNRTDLGISGEAGQDLSAPPCPTHLACCTAVRAKGGGDRGEGRVTVVYSRGKRFRAMQLFCGFLLFFCGEFPKT